MCDMLPGLNRLVLDKCYLVRTYWDDRQRVTLLCFRSLEIQRTPSAPTFIQMLPKSNLLAYSARAVQSQQDSYLEHVFAIPSMRQLTRLELMGYGKRVTEGELAGIHALGLLELVLIDSPSISVSIFVPNALKTLQRLHVTETDPFEKHGAAYQEDIQSHSGTNKRVRAARRLLEKGRIILGLPKLVEISGHSLMTRFVMADGLTQWSRSDYLAGSMTAHDKGVAKYAWSRVL